MNLFLKFCIILDALFILSLLAVHIRVGIFSRKYDSEYDRVMHRKFRVWIYGSFLVLLAFVLCLRSDDLTEQGRISTLLIVHWIAVAILIVVTVLIEWRYNGKKRPKVHYRFAYFGFIPALITVVITGTILTVQA